MADDNSGSGGRPTIESTETPFPFPTSESHEKLPGSQQPVVLPPSEDALDAGVEESFPASDPVSVTVTKVVPFAGDAARQDADPAG